MLMLIPSIRKPNPEVSTEEFSSDSAQDPAESMGKQSEEDNASAKSLPPGPKNSFINASEEDTDNLCDQGQEQEDDDLTLSEGDRYISADEEEEDAERIQNAQGDEIGEKLKNELTKYKQELMEYNETTKDLEKKYMKINHELNEMQHKHDQIVNRQSELDPEDNSSLNYIGSNTSIGSNSTVKQKKKMMFCSNTSLMTVLETPPNIPIKRQDHQRSGKKRHTLSAQVDDVYSHHIVDSLANRHRLRSSEDQENEPAPMKNMYNALRVMNKQHDDKHKYIDAYDRDTGQLSQLYCTIKDLKTEQHQFRNIIREQQDRLTDYHTRCLKAQEIMKTQKHEIDKLNVNNKHLESSIYQDIDTLRSKIDSKIKSVAQLPQLVRQQHSKYEKVLRENCVLAEKMQELQQDASGLKAKIDELGKRKLITVNRLKAAERDLKIFKNYNAALKTEKHRLSDELSSTKEQLVALQVASKRQLTRHREQTEKQRRELQKRIYDLELKLSRSQNSTSSLIQERDSLIAELQTQLHTLVHNFEVSQKHIRVLRRHIYSMTSSGGGGMPQVTSSNSSSLQRPNNLNGEQNHQQRLQGPSANAVRLNTPRTLKTRA